VIGCQWNDAVGPDAKSIQTISMILSQLAPAEFSVVLGKPLAASVERHRIGIAFLFCILVSDGVYRFGTGSRHKSDEYRFFLKSQRLK
jgi:hypothetical protein